MKAKRAALVLKIKKLLAGQDQVMFRYLSRLEKQERADANKALKVPVQEYQKFERK